MRIVVYAGISGPELDPEITDWCITNNINVSHQTEDLCNEKGEVDITRIISSIDVSGKLATEFFLRFM